MAATENGRLREVFADVVAAGEGFYEELGWRQIGTVPGAIEGQDAIIYWRAVG